MKHLHAVMDPVSSGPSASLTKEQIKEIIEDLKNDRKTIADIPERLHPSLFTAISMAKVEAKIGCCWDMYDKLNDIAWSLKLTPVMPERDLYQARSAITSPVRSRSLATTGQLTETLYNHNVPLITSIIEKPDSANNEMRRRRLESEKAAAEKFWKDEEKRLVDMKNKAMRKLNKKHTTFQFSADPVDASIEKTEMECESNNLKRIWLEKEIKLKNDRNDEIRRIRDKIDELDFSNLYAAGDDRTPRTRKSAKTQRVRSIPVNKRLYA